jgi:hypothetical protein
LHRAISKYGWDNFVKEILEVCHSKEELNDREKFWIKELDARDKTVGYNISAGGEFGDTLSMHPRKKEIFAQIKQTSMRIDEETGLTVRKLGGRKAAATRKLVGSDGLTTDARNGLRIKEHLSSIDEATGLTYAKCRGMKVKITNSKVLASGLTTYQEIGRRSALTKTTVINKETGLTIGKTGGRKLSNTLLTKIDTATGLTLGKLNGQKTRQTNSKIQLTGLTIYQENGKRQSLTKTTSINKETGLTISQTGAIRASASMKQDKDSNGLTKLQTKAIAGAVTKLTKKLKSFDYDKSYIERRAELLRLDLTKLAILDNSFDKYRATSEIDINTIILTNQKLSSIRGSLTILRNKLVKTTNLSEHEIDKQLEAKKAIYEHKAKVQIIKEQWLKTINNNDNSA